MGNKFVSDNLAIGKKKTPRRLIQKYILEKKRTTAYTQIPTHTHVNFPKTITQRRRRRRRRRRRQQRPIEIRQRRPIKKGRKNGLALHRNKYIYKYLHFEESTRKKKRIPPPLSLLIYEAWGNLDFSKNQYLEISPMGRREMSNVGQMCL